jgi:Spy/CpxP family protein refolding chaperone
MRMNHWKAVTVAAVFLMTASALVALAADKTDKTDKTKPAAKTTEQAMPGCTMHADAAKAGAACKPGCTMHGETAKGATACKPGCAKRGEMQGCGMKGGMGKGGCCQSGDMKACGMKGGKNVAVCVMSGDDKKGCGKMGGMGMAGCGSRGDGTMERRTVMVLKNGDEADGPMGGMGMGPGMGPGPGAGPGAMMLRGLDLNADQQKKVTAIHEKQARLMVQSQADVRIAAMDLRQLLRADAPDKAKIDAQIDRLAQLRAGLAKSRAATMLEVRALLTPEQLKKLQDGPMWEEEED